MKDFTATDWIGICAALGTLVGAVTAGTLKVLAAIKEIHLAINSRMDELVAETRKASMAEGKEAGRLMQRATQAEAIIVTPSPLAQVKKGPDEHL